MYQKQIVVGRLTRDAESKQVGSNTVARFSVAVETGWGDNKRTDFFNCSAWGARGNGILQYGKKGALVLVEGTMRSSKSGDTTYWELSADNIRILEFKNDNSQGGYQQQASPAPTAQPEANPFGGTADWIPSNDDLPF